MDDRDGTGPGGSLSGPASAPSDPSPFLDPSLRRPSPPASTATDKSKDPKKMMAPPFIKVPTDPSASDFLSGPFRHFISPAQFSTWQRNNPLDKTRLRPSPFASAAALAATASSSSNAPTSTGTAAAGNRKDRVGTYEPPKHPAAEVLANIPSRRTSSRCNIVDWMLWLAANERRQAGRVSVGMRRRAETRAAKRRQQQPAEEDIISDDDDEDEAGEGDSEDRKEVVEKVAKARQLSVQARTMLDATPVRSPRHHLPHPDPAPPPKKTWTPALEKRRVYEDAVSSLVKLPYSSSASASTRQATTTGTGGLPPELSRLAPLARTSTAQTSPAAVASSANVDGAGPTATTSRGQSLLQKKLAAEEAARSHAASPDTTAADPQPQHPYSTAMSGATPHADYRIIYSDQRRRRAEEIFRGGVPAVTEWCVGHRVRHCPDCSKPFPTREAAGSRRTMVMVMGKEEEEERSLANGISAMVLLTADVLRRYERRVSGLDEDDDAADASQSAQRHRPDAAWFSVMFGLIVQSLLDGYLVHGWKGAACVDLITGIGSAGAVKAWKNWTPATSFAATTTTGARGKEQRAEKEGERGQEAAEEDEEGGGERQRRKEEEEQEVERERKLVDAAAFVLGAAGAQKGDFERTLRDMGQEFFDVPPGMSLADHLDRLSVKYPRSESDEQMLDWLEAVDRSLGKPELAKYEERAAAALDGPASTPSSLASATLQLHASSTAGLERYFQPVDEWHDRGEASVGRKRAVTVGVPEVGAGDMGATGEGQKRARIA